MVLGLFKTDAQRIAIIIADVVKEHISNGGYVKHIQKLENLLGSLSATDRKWAPDDIAKALASMFLMLKEDLERAKNPRDYKMDASRSYTDMIPHDFDIFQKALDQVHKKFRDVDIYGYIKKLESSANAPRSSSRSNSDETNSSGTVWAALQEARGTAGTEDWLAQNVVAEKYKRMNSEVANLGLPFEPNHMVLHGNGRKAAATKKYVKTQLKTRSPVTGRLCTVYEHAQKPSFFYIRRRRSADGAWVHVRVKQIKP